MKEFISVFIICLAGCWFATVFLLGLIISNVWSILIIVAFLLALLITVLMKQEARIEEQKSRIIEQESRIEKLEKKVENSLNNS